MNRLGLYSLAFLVLLADQLSKREVVRTMAVNQSRDLLPFFALAHVHNTGGAFSILPGSTLWLAAAAMFAALAIAFWVSRARMPLPRDLAVGLALPLGGALGNLCDRIRLGYVVDFLDLHIGAHQWPVFNVADSAICIGVALLAIRGGRRSEKTASDALPSEGETVGRRG